MKLPIDFLDRMKTLLGETEFKSFLESFDKPRYYGLRINTLKISVDEFVKISPFSLEPIPWTKDGFYYKEGESPGRHPYYHAGLYYIQEPSAMLPGAIINPQPGERILDLCAAPGGKTVQIAAGMQGTGLLVANDISSDRVKALVKNIELCGVRNAIVTNESPDKLARNFSEFFDKILVDAPCSGEGMFRKDLEAARSWEKFKCDTCAGMQRDILKYVDEMLKPGGKIVYSTCTFSPEEDEKMISEFLAKHTNYELIDVPKIDGIQNGRPDWSDGNEELVKTARLWPHKLKGEGHFVAMLQKNVSTNIDSNTISEQTQPLSLKKEFRNTMSSRCNNLEVRGKNSKSQFASPTSYLQPLTSNGAGVGLAEVLTAFHTFANENLNINIEGHFDLKGNNLYWLPEQPPDLSGIRIAKFGWYLGEFSNGRFDPSHSMIISLKKEDIKNVTDFVSDSREIISYLKGETLMLEGKKGLTAICVDGHTLGWAKQTGDMLKNRYPKGWRKMN